MLINHALAPSTFKTYCRQLKVFAEFVLLTENSVNFFPPSIRSILRFICFLYSYRNLSPASVQTYITAISYFGKLMGLEDIGKKFAVQKLLGAYKRVGEALESRYPITFDLLIKLVCSIDNFGFDVYHAHMFKAAFMIAFHGFLRVSEFTCISSSKFGHCLLLENIAFRFNERNENFLEITFKTWKHSMNQGQFTLLIQERQDKSFCPVETMKRYLALRGSNPGPIFVHPNGHPLTRDYFTPRLMAISALAGFGNLNIKSHSFRIGAATSASMMGYPDDYIKRLGRWRSDAFLRYVRIPQFYC